MAEIVTLDPIAITLDKLFRDAIGDKKLTWEQSWADKRGTTYFTNVDGTTCVLIDLRHLYLVPAPPASIPTMSRDTISRTSPGITGSRWVGTRAQRQTFHKIATVAAHAEAQLLERFGDRLAEVIRTMPTPQLRNPRFSAADNIVELTGRKQEAAIRETAPKDS